MTLDIPVGSQQNAGMNDVFLHLRSSFRRRHRLQSSRFPTYDFLLSAVSLGRRAGRYTTRSTRPKLSLCKALMNYRTADCCPPMMDHYNLQACWTMLETKRLRETGENSVRIDGVVWHILAPDASSGLGVQFAYRYCGRRSTTNYARAMGRHTHRP